MKLIIHLKWKFTYMNTGYTGGLDWSGGLTTTNEQTGFYHFYVQNNSDNRHRYTDEVNFGNPSFSIQVHQIVMLMDMGVLNTHLH